MSMASDGYEALTLREKQVCDLVVQGFTNRIIARRFGLAVKTVDSQVCSVLKKTACCNRVVLTRELVNVAWVPA